MDIQFNVAALVAFLLMVGAIFFEERAVVLVWPW